MKLLIVESPSKTKKIEGFLGPGWKVMASFGHIRDLPQKEIGVSAPDFIPKYVSNSRSQAQLKKLRSAAQNADEVYLATDPDREGEAISWHLQQALKLKSHKRVTFHEITKHAVLDAVSKPRTIDYNLVKAQEARRVADRLVGYLVSPTLSQSRGMRLSAGRVQSVAVRLVVDREQEISIFKPTNYYVPRIYFRSAQIDWHADWDAKIALPADQDYLQDRAMAQELSKLKDFVVIDTETKQVTSKPPAPFTTSTMQQAASVALKFNPKKSMQLAQALFEAGLITYHRTDCQNLSVEATNEIREWLASSKFKNELPDKPNTWRSKDGSQEAHEAIRPTSIHNIKPADIDAEAFSLYKLIWIRAVSSQMKPAKYKATILRLESVGHVAGKKQPFIARGRVLIAPGWTTLTSDDHTVEHGGQDNDDTGALPDLNVKQELTAKDGEVLERSTKPPARYTEASLIKKLEREGIGRPSTYASILENIISRGYVKVTKRKLAGTDIGEVIVSALVKRFQFMELTFTKNLENQLDNIASGTDKYQQVISILHKTLTSELGQLEGDPVQKQEVVKSDKDCPSCGKPMILRNGQYGKFYGCSGYPDCKETIQHGAGKRSKKKSAKRMTGTGKTGDNCPTCGKGQIIQRTFKSGPNQGQPFLGCSCFPKCKHFEFINNAA